MYWKTVIEIDFDCYDVTYNTVLDPSSLIGVSELGKYQKSAQTNPILINAESNYLDFTTSNLYGNPRPWLKPNIPSIVPTKNKVGSGKTKFEIIWSATLTTSQKLTQPKIDSISFIETRQI